MQLLYKGTIDDIRLECTVTQEYTYIPRKAATKLVQMGFIHPGVRYTMADGKTWLDVENALIEMGVAC